MVEKQRIHGSPEDRGSADRYYGRSRNPHKFPNGTHVWPRINTIDLTKKELRMLWGMHKKLKNQPKS